MDAASELLQRRMDELIALLAVYSEEIELEAVAPAELRAAVREGAFDASVHPHFGGIDIQLTLTLRDAPPAPKSGSSSSARLQLLLPPAYPASAQLQVLALTCDGLGRAEEGQLQQQAEAVARVAAAQGQECLCQVVEALLPRLRQQHGAAAARRAAHAPGPGTEQQQRPAQRLALLRLDHMQSRATYSRTVRRWAQQLGLGGRLLFCGGTPARPALIFILLAGPGEGVREYLVRQRTRSVDVDSKGRERMMSVVCDAEWPQRGGSGTLAALFSDFREEELSVAQLAVLFRGAGLEAHWGAATGLPALSPADLS